MAPTILAVVRDGAFHPRVPTALADGTAVELVVMAAVPPPDPRRAIDLLREIAAMPEEAGGDKAVTGRDHDRTLYGPAGAR
jgi:hypothetical protein